MSVVIFCVLGYVMLGFGLALLYHMAIVLRWLPESEDIDFLYDNDEPLAAFMVAWPLMIIAFIVIALYLGSKWLFGKIVDAIDERVTKKEEVKGNDN